jgi:hypothetical protein
VHGSYFCVLASKSACRPYAPFFSGFGSKPGSKSSITAFHGIHSQYRPKEPGFKVSGRLTSMPWRTSGCAWCTSNYGSTCTSDFRPKGALLSLLIGTPASGGHPDPVAGIRWSPRPRRRPDAGVRSRSCGLNSPLYFPLPLADSRRPRHCSHTADARATRDRGRTHSGLGPSLNSVSETRETSKYSKHQG